MNTQQNDNSTLNMVKFNSLSTVMMSVRPEGMQVADDVDWAQFQVDVIAVKATLDASPYQRWALCFDDSYLFLVAFLALAYAEKEIVLPGNHQPSALEELVDQFDAMLHDHSDNKPLDIPEVQLPLSQTDTSSQDFLFEALRLSHHKVTLFTSGSSGTPKAIVKTLANIDAEICHLEQVWGDQLNGASIVSTVSHQHIYGLLFRVLWPLCSGRPFSRKDFSYPEQVVDASDNNTILISSPALLKRLEYQLIDTPYRAIFSSGGPLSLDIAHQTQSMFEQLPIEVFGSTETGGIGYRQQKATDTPWKKFDVIDLALNLDGCLQLKSPYLETNDWYQTTDLCEILGSDHFRVMGRSDRVVKVEEKRISLVEVERHLCSLTWIEEAVVLPLEESNRLVIASVITLSKEGQESLAKLGRGKLGLTIRQALRQWVEPVGIPRRFRVVDEIPQNSQGKHQVSELHKLFID